MTVAEVTRRYYAAFRTAGDFADVPMADDLRFTGPLQRYADGPRYRADCARLAGRVRALAMRHQFVDGDRVHSVYDFDLGLPTGPIATSETLTFDGGRMVAAELIIDSTPLRAGAAS